MLDRRPTFQSGRYTWLLFPRGHSSLVVRVDIVPDRKKAIIGRAYVGVGGFGFGWRHQLLKLKIYYCVEQVRFGAFEISSV